MAEFGEKLKNARTEKGLTQQTLADQLFVTRQAVSRWEGGSRYPDLMTAKKLSDILDTSLDDLLRDDDLTSYPQKNPILESPVSKVLQTVLISAVLMCYLIICIWHIKSLNTIIVSENGRQVFTFITPFLYTCVLLYAAIMSIQDKWSPRIAAIIAASYYGIHAFTCIVDFFRLTFDYRAIYIGPALLMLKGLAYIVILFLFWSYFQKGSSTPHNLYVISVLCAASRIYNFIEQFTSALSHPQFEYFYATGTVRALADILFLGLLCYMVNFLHNKRKRSTI